MYIVANLFLKYVFAVLSALIVPAAAAGAVGYAYMWWKVRVLLYASSQFFNDICSIYSIKHVAYKKYFPFEVSVLLHCSPLSEILFSICTHAYE